MTRTSLGAGQARGFKLSRKNGCTQCSPNIVFKHPVALIYHLFHAYFRLQCSLLSSHISAVCGHHRVASVLLKLLHCI
jgi:hypothetical protein